MGLTVREKWAPLVTVRLRSAYDQRSVARCSPAEELLPKHKLVGVVSFGLSGQVRLPLVKKKDEIHPQL